MDRETKKSESSGFDDMKFKLASLSERDEWLRTFPNPLPESHELRYHWVDDMNLVIGVHVKSDPKAKETHKAVTDLSGLSLPELQTAAAERGIDVPKGATKHAIAAAIEKHERA